MNNYKLNRALVVTATLAALASAKLASAQVVYSDDFGTAGDAANYNVFITAGATGPSGDATFAYDYSALGIPAAPHTTDGSTLGVRLRTDNLQSSVGTVVGAAAIATKGLSLGSQYKVTVDVWGNYIGGTSIAASGSNGSTGATVGVGTAGTSLQYVAGNDGFMTETFHDNGGGANQAYRIYLNNAHPSPTTAPYWAAGTSATSASNTDPYYSFLGTHTAPASQVTSNPTTQGGTTAVGTMGFAWHTVGIDENGTTLSWSIDGVLIATVPNSAVTFAGGQISLGADDTGLTGNSAAANQLLNADIFDNLTIVVPEPSTTALLGLGGLALVARFRRKK